MQQDFYKEGKMQQNTFANLSEMQCFVTILVRNDDTFEAIFGNKNRLCATFLPRNNVKCISFVFRWQEDSREGEGDQIGKYVFTMHSGPIDIVT